MPVNYDPTMDTDRDKVRFHLGDTDQGEGPRPKDANYSDAEIDALVTSTGSWQKTVATLLDVLAIEWTRHATIHVGPRSQDFSDVARGYRLQAKEWRRENNILPGVIVAGVIRVDGYSDDVPSDDVDTVSEYATKRIYYLDYAI